MNISVTPVKHIEGKSGLIFVPIPLNTKILKNVIINILIKKANAFAIGAVNIESIKILVHIIKGE
jgi:hypothetical protein